MQDFYDFFVKELRDIYNAELQILKVLPQMAKAVTSTKLHETFLHHHKETEGQIDRLERVGKMLRQDLKGEACKAMRGLIEEAKELLKTPYEEDTKDAAVICAARRIEHYEIAAYQSLKAYAKHLEFPEVETLLSDTLEEETAADKKLLSLAEGSLFRSGINSKACSHCVTT